MKKKKKRMHVFRLLNPKNLQKEVHVYGYNFSERTHLLILFLTLLGLIAIGLVFRIRPFGMAVIGAGALCAIPVLVLDMYKRMYQQKRFEDVLSYMEQMLYSFQKNGKILSSLRETAECFSGGMMRESVDKAVAYIEAGKAKTDAGLLKEALSFVEINYGCKKLFLAHELMLSAEEYGGDFERSLLMIMKDMEIWKRRIYRLQQDKKNTHTDNVMSIIMATILCAACLYVFDYMKVMFDTGILMDVFTTSLVQVTSVMFILMNMYVFLRSMKSLTKDWLSDDFGTDSESIRKAYDDVVNYDEKKETKRSALFAIPFLVAAIPAYFLFSKVIAIVFILVGAFLSVQHRIGINLARKDVVNAMYVAFPQWLMDMALLLQNNNVQVSIQKSRENAPAVLERELEDLQERILKEPEKVSSYTGFCAGFDIPETQSCMKMLYSISEAGVGSAQEQITNLLKNISEIQEQADKIQDENAAFKMRLIFSYPVAAAAVKMLIDMTVGMVAMFQLFGAIH